MKNNKLFISMAITGLIVIGGIYLVRPRRQQNQTNQEALPQVTQTPGDINQQTDSEDKGQIERTNPQKVIEVFLDSFMEAAPPDINQESVNQAVSYLSEGAKMAMTEPYSAGDLARFLGAQDIPDQGYEIGETFFKDNPASGINDGLAEVNVTLKYSGGNVNRTFQLSMAEGLWQIDSVMVPAEN